MKSNLSILRACHSRQVSLLMKEYAPLLNLNPEEAGLCGWLHDFGYISGNNCNHAKIGGKLLHDQGYKYWKEISTHGSCDGLFSPLGVLLNIADMSVDHRGKTVSFEERLDDVAKRYGRTSTQWENCLSLIAALKKTDEWAIIQSTLGKAHSEPTKDQIEDTLVSLGPGEMQP